MTVRMGSKGQNGCWSHRFEIQPQGYGHPNHGERRIYEWEERKCEDSVEMLTLGDKRWRSLLVEARRCKYWGY